MISLKIAWCFLGDKSFANYKKNEFEALGSLFENHWLGAGIWKMKLTWPVAIICSIGNVELEIRQCLLGNSAMWRLAMWTWQLAKWSLQHGKGVRSTKLLAKWTWQNRKHQLDKDLRKIRKTNLAKWAKQRVFHNTFLDRVCGWWQVPIWWSWASWSHFATIFYSELCVLPQYYRTATACISTGAQYVALPWKSWMRHSSQIQWIPWKTAVTLKKCTTFRALELSNKHSQIIFIDCSCFSSAG